MFFLGLKLQFLVQFCVAQSCIFGPQLHLQHTYTAAMITKPFSPLVPLHCKTPFCLKCHLESWHQSQVVFKWQVYHPFVCFPFVPFSFAIGFALLPLTGKLNCLCLFYLTFHPHHLWHSAWLKHPWNSDETESFHGSVNSLNRVVEVINKKNVLGDKIFIKTCLS